MSSPPNREVNRVEGCALNPQNPASTHLKTLDSSQKTPLEGVGEPTVSGYTGAIGSESSPIPLSGAFCHPATNTQTATKSRPPTTEKTAVSCYLELQDSDQKFVPKPVSRNKETACGKSAITGVCEIADRLAFTLWCGREWCEKCRKVMHNRRISRLLPKARQFETAGYWVVTYPEELRPTLRTKKALSLARSRLLTALKLLGYRRGFLRWHFFGDKSLKYHPHQNALVDGRYLDPDELDRQKEFIRKSILSPWEYKSYKGKLDIHYRYCKTPRRIYHTLKYILRATFKERAWDETMAERLYRFHNAMSWGKWDETAKWSVQPGDLPSIAEQRLAQKLCPVCGRKIEWFKKPVPLSQLLAENPVEIAPGIYHLPPIPDRPAWLLNKDLHHL